MQVLENPVRLRSRLIIKEEPAIMPSMLTVLIRAHRHLLLFIVLALLPSAASFWQLSLELVRAAEPATPILPRTLIRNASLIITMDPKLGEGPLGTLTDADVLIVGDTIVTVGKQLSPLNVTIVDATGTIVLPGFVDLHNHLVQSIIRGGCSDYDLNAWLHDCAWPAYKALTPEDVYAAVRLSTLDLIGTGVTTVVDWAGGLKFEVSHEYLRALTESGMRFVYAPTPRKEELGMLKKLYDEVIKPNPLAMFQLAGASGMQHLTALTEAVRLAQEWGVGLNVHLLEHIRQREGEPVRSLEQSGALALRGHLLVNHAIHLTDEEISLLAKHDVRIAHNPLSNMRLASGIIRLPDLDAAGLKLGLGLDGSTNDTSDMFNDMRAAVGLQRAKTLQAGVYPTVKDVIRMATLGGAEALDMADQIGSLTPGKKADLIIIDPARVNFAPRFDWIGQLVFNGQPANITFVFVNGVALKAHGEFVGVAETEAVKAAELAAARLRENMGRNRLMPPGE
jgi:5-methylthioadenosine/S-adenosylhomocysteine deaminase